MPRLRPALVSLLLPFFIGAVQAGQAVSAGEPEAVLELKFGDFFQRPIGAQGLALSQRLQAANGRTVRLVGYAVGQEAAQPGRFLLTPRPVRLSEHADGDADDLPPGTVTVLLDESQRSRVVAHQGRLLSLVGRLEVGRQEDANGRVSWIRLQLAPDALALAPSPAEPGPHAHHAH